MTKNKFYKVYNDYIVRDSIDGNIQFDTDVLTVIEMVEYDKMGIELFYSNRDKIGQDILYKSKPFRIQIDDYWSLVEIVEKVEPIRRYGKLFYKEVQYFIEDRNKNKQEVKSISSQLGVSLLPKNLRNMYSNELSFFLVNPFAPVSYSRMQEHIMSIIKNLEGETILTI